MATRPFPAIGGGCKCTSVRYRLLTSPLVCSACHCTDCQKETGSAFSLNLSIEAYNVSIISATKPSLVTTTPYASRPEKQARRAVCPKCGTVLWGNDNPWGYAVSNVRIGTLDWPGVMEPDAHSFIGDKLPWIGLPENAHTSEGFYDWKQVWPKSSLKRLDICLERFEAAKKSMEEQKVGKEDAAAVGKSGATVEKDEGTADGDGEKTPTAVAGDDDEDDEAFEKRFRETERVLQERLAKLTLKLGGDEKQGESPATT